MRRSRAGAMMFLASAANQPQVEATLPMARQSGLAERGIGTMFRGLGKVILVGAMIGAAFGTPALAQQAAYNHGNGSTTTIGSDRQSGGATEADRRSVQDIQDSFQRQRQMRQHP